jgi:hypothetical protein
MTRERPNIPVAVISDDGTSRIGTADELRAQKEAHEAKTRPTPAPVAGQKLSTIEILQHLAVAKRAHTAFYADEPDARIPATLIDAIAIALAGEGEWLKAQKGLQAGNEEKQSERDRRRDEARAGADKLRAAGLRDGDIVKKLAEEMDLSTKTIGRYLTKN